MVRSMPKIWIESRITWRACGTVMPWLNMPSPDSFTCTLGNAAMAVSALRHCSIISGARSVSMPECSRIIGTLGNALISSTAYCAWPANTCNSKCSPVFFQQREAAAEIRPVAQIRRRIGLAQRMAVPMQLMAHAAQIGKLLLRLQLGVEIGVGHLGLADDAVRKAVLVGDRLQPARLVERARHAPHGGNVHRLHHIVRRDVVHPFLDRVIAAQAEIFAIHARDRRIGEPWNIQAPPNVMVRVDRRSAVGRHVSPVYCFSTRTTLTTASVKVLSSSVEMVKAGVR